MVKKHCLSMQEMWVQILVKAPLEKGIATPSVFLKSMERGAWATVPQVTKCRWDLAAPTTTTTSSSPSTLAAQGLLEEARGLLKIGAGRCLGEDQSLGSQRGSDPGSAIGSCWLQDVPCWLVAKNPCSPCKGLEFDLVGNCSIQSKIPTPPVKDLVRITDPAQPNKINIFYKAVQT